MYFIPKCIYSAYSLNENSKTYFKHVFILGYDCEIVYTAIFLHLYLFALSLLLKCISHLPNRMQENKAFILVYVT